MRKSPHTETRYGTRQTNANQDAPLVLTSPEPKPQRTDKTPREKPLTKTERYELNQAAYAFPTADPIETRYRHQHWQAKRDLVRAALLSTAATPRQLEAFDNCGAQCSVEYCPETKRYRCRANHCKNRHCAPCAAAKAGVLAANLRDKLAGIGQREYRFITLTLRHSDQPLSEQIKRLYASFRRLRKSATWHKSQDGGCAILEVKWDAKSRGWHPHLHIVAQGRYLPQKALANEWHAITGDSFIVDVRPLHSGKDAAHYVAKYVSKGTVDAVWADASAAQEWVIATKGVRSASTFGTWRGYKLLARRPDTHDWVPCGRLETIYTEARRGNIRCQQILKCLAQDNQYNPHRKRGHNSEPQ